MATRDELVAAVAARYGLSTRAEKKAILDEFTAVTGLHRKHAMRLLRSGPGPRETVRPARRTYTDATREALVVIWEASDRVCGKRLKAMLPLLVEGMERHGHLRLDPGVKEQLLAMSSASIDRALLPARESAGRSRRRPPASAVRASIPVRTHQDWDNPPPGFMEADLVLHCGTATKGSYLQTLVLTDIATGWTECAPLLVREQRLLTQVLDEVVKMLPFPLLGLDTDNDSVFMNETLQAWCAEAGVEFTRCRPYRKNDQAWVEQKNGAVVRRIVGYRRLEGLEAAACLGRLYADVRRFVNFYQPSFKLVSKERDGAKVRKRHQAPATPCQRLQAHPQTPSETKSELEGMVQALDPVRLLRDIRSGQTALVAIADKVAAAPAGKEDPPPLDAFLAGLRTAWQGGEVRPTALPKAKQKRARRRPDPFAAVDSQLRDWFLAEPWRTSREFLDRLQGEHPGRYPDGQIRTLQRRLKIWRMEHAHALVFGSGNKLDAHADAPSGASA